MFKFGKYSIDKISSIKCYDKGSELLSFSSESDKILYDNTLYVVEKLLTKEIYTGESLWNLCEPNFTNITESQHKIPVHEVILHIPGVGRRYLEEKIILNYADCNEIDRIIALAQCDWQYERLTHKFLNYPKKGQKNEM